MPTHLKIEWKDRNREPQCAPNPEFPNGKDIDISDGAQKKCTAHVPYPAKRCGVYVIKCMVCGMKIGVTTAGRPDDPRSVTLPCFVYRPNSP